MAPARTPRRRSAGRGRHRAFPRGALRGRGPRGRRGGHRRGARFRARHAVRPRRRGGAAPRTHDSSRSRGGRHEARRSPSVGRAPRSLPSGRGRARRMGGGRRGDRARRVRFVARRLPRGWGAPASVANALAPGNGSRVRDRRVARARRAPRERRRSLGGARRSEPAPHAGISVERDVAPARGPRQRPLEAGRRDRRATGTVGLERRASRDRGRRGHSRRGDRVHPGAANETARHAGGPLAIVAREGRRLRAAPSSTSGGSTSSNR